MPRHKFEAKYIYPKQKKAMSYKDYLHRQVEEMKTLGAKIEVKEYTGRPPAVFGDDSFTGRELKELNLVLVLVKGPGRNGALCAATYVDRSYYYGTIKTAERADMDYMLASVDALLGPTWEYVNGKSR